MDKLRTILEITGVTDVVELTDSIRTALDDLTLYDNRFTIMVTGGEGDKSPLTYVDQITVTPIDNSVQIISTSGLFTVTLNTDTTLSSKYIVTSTDDTGGLVGAINGKEPSEDNVVKLVVSSSITPRLATEYYPLAVSTKDLNEEAIRQTYIQARVQESLWLDHISPKTLNLIEEVKVGAGSFSVDTSGSNATLTFKNEDGTTITSVDLLETALQGGYKSASETTNDDGLPVLTLTDFKDNVTSLELATTVKYDSNADGVKDRTVSVQAVVDLLFIVVRGLGREIEEGGISEIETEYPISGDGTENDPVKLEKRSISQDYLSPQVLAAVKSGGQGEGEYKVLSRLSKREVFHVPLQNFGFDSDGNPLSDDALNELLGDIVSVYKNEYGHDVYLTSKGWTSDSSQRIEFRKTRAGGVSDVLGNVTFHDAATHGHNDRFYVIASIADEFGGRPQLFRVVGRQVALRAGDVTALNPSTDASWVDYIFTGGTASTPSIVNIEVITSNDGRDVTTRFTTRLAARPYSATGFATIGDGARAFTRYKEDNEYLVAYTNPLGGTDLRFYALSRFRATTNAEKSFLVSGVTGVNSVTYDADSDHIILVSADEVVVTEFVDVPTLTGLSDTPDAYEKAGQVLTVKDDRTGTEWSDIGTQIGTRDPREITIEGDEVPIYGEATYDGSRYFYIFGKPAEDFPIEYSSVGIADVYLTNPASVHEPLGYQLKKGDVGVSSMMLISSGGVRLIFPRHRTNEPVQLTDLPLKLIIDNVVFTRNSIRDTGTETGIAAIEEPYTAVQISYLREAGADPLTVHSYPVSLQIPEQGAAYSIERISSEDVVTTAVSGVKGDEYFHSGTKQHFIHDGALWRETGSEPRLFDRLSSIDQALGAHPEGLLQNQASWVPTLLDSTISPSEDVNFISGSKIGDKEYVLMDNKRVYELTNPSSVLFTLNLDLPGDLVGYTSALMDVLVAGSDTVNTAEEKQLHHFVLRRDPAAPTSLNIDRYTSDGAYSNTLTIAAPEVRADCFVEGNNLHVIAEVNTALVHDYEMLFAQRLTNAPSTNTIHSTDLGGRHFQEFGGCDYYDGKLYVSLLQDSDDATSNHYIVRPLTKRTSGGAAESAWQAGDSPLDATVPGHDSGGVGLIVTSATDFIFITAGRATLYSPMSGDLETRVAQNRELLSTAQETITQLQNETNGLLAALNAHSGVYQVESTQRLQDFETQPGDDFSSGAEFVGASHEQVSSTERVTVCIRQGNQLHVRGFRNFSFSNPGTASNPVIGFEQLRVAMTSSTSFETGFIVVFRSGLWLSFSATGTQTGSATLQTSNPGDEFESLTLQPESSGGSFLWATTNTSTELRANLYRVSSNGQTLRLTSNNITRREAHFPIRTWNALLGPRRRTLIAYYDDRIFETYKFNGRAQETYTTSVRQVNENSFTRVPTGLGASVPTTALNTTVPAPTLDFTNEIKSIHVDNRDFTYTLAGISVRLTIGTVIDTYRPTDTVLYNGSFSTPIKNRWYLPSLSAANQAKIDSAADTAELTIAIQYASFSSSAVTATATGNIAICEFELPIVVFRDFLKTIPGSSSASSITMLGRHSRLSNRVQNPSPTSAMGRAIYVGKDSAGRIRIATSDEQNFRVTELHITLLE